MWKTIGFETPVGVRSRSSRWPGSASGATVTSIKTRPRQGGARGPIAVFGYPPLNPRNEIACALALARGGCCLCRGCLRRHHRVLGGHHGGFRAHHHRGSFCWFCPLEFLDLLVQQGHVLGVQSPEAFDHPRGNSRAGDQHLTRLLQPLPAHLHREGRPLLAPRRINEANIWPRLGRGGPRDGQQE